MTATSVSGHLRNGRPVASYTQSRASGSAVPRHRSQGRAELSIAGGAFLILYSLIELLYVTVSTLTAVLVALTVTLLGFAGWMQRRRVRQVRRRATRHVSRTVRRHNGGRRSSSPAMYQAATDRKVRLREQRQRRRDEVWGRRKAAAVSAARLGVAKVRQGWSQ